MSLKNVPSADPVLVSIPSPRQPWSLAARLATWYAASAFVLILVATGFLYWVLVTDFEREGNQFLADQIHILRALLLDHSEDMTSVKQEAEWESVARQGKQAFVRVIAENGEVLVQTPGMSAELPVESFPVAVSADAKPGLGAELRSQSGKPFRAASAWAVAGRSPSERRMIQVALDRSQEEELLADYRHRLWLVLGLALALCTLGGYLIARRGIRPVKDIIDAARRIHSTTLHERLEIAGLPAELSALADTFNDMLDRLETSFGRLARFSADIAHELRTPVNNLRGEAEVTLGKPRSSEEYREVIGSCLEEAVRLSQMIDSLLFLARAEHPETKIAKESADVGQELRRVHEFFEVAALEAFVQIEVSAVASIFVRLDRSLFQRAVCNLLANALAHTPRGGRVALSAIQEDGKVRVEVSDTGCGIPAAHLPHLFDRFYRVDGARPSVGGHVGLGLAIVKGIMDLHGGSVSIGSEVGRGTCVSLFFPAR